VDLTTSSDAAQLLDASERERAARLRFDRDRARFITGRVALRSILGDLLDRDPARIVFDLGAHGRPSLRDAAGLEFNMSHSGDVALIAVSAAGALGVDVEVLREVRRVLDLARRYLHPEELRVVEDAAPCDRGEVFLTCWTRKEAVLKSTGVGLTHDTRTLNVGATATEKILDLPHFPRLRLASFSPAAGYMAACATAPGVRRIDFHHYELSIKNRAP